MGLVTWVVLMAIRIQSSSQDTEMHKLALQGERMRIADDMISQIRQRMGNSLLPGPGLQNNSQLSSKLQELIKTAGGSHPEVDEIDHTDYIIGVRFEGDEYPPTVDDDDDEE
jgi:hypothetical protein